VTRQHSASCSKPGLLKLMVTASYTDLQIRSQACSAVADNSAGLTQFAAPCSVVDNTGHHSGYIARSR
jgi:hypothetical protein